MKHFFKIAENVNVMPLMTELQRKPKLWDANNYRTKFEESPHHEVSDILVFFNEFDADNPDLVVNDKDVVSYPAWNELPALKPLVHAMLAQVQGVRLGRVIITKLPPGKKIEPHTDGGAPAEYFDRYQIALQCEPGNVFYIGDEEVSFKTGEVWMINNNVEHAVVNNSKTDRIVLIIDIRSE